jgi:hypothetical protein
MNKPTDLKKPYVSPSLVEYGSVAEFTLGVGSMNGDTGQIMMDPPVM